MPNYVSKERLYLTIDRDKVVPEGDPDAAFLLAGEGGVIAEAEARRYGLLDQVEPEPDRSALMRETGYSTTVEEEREALQQAEERRATGEAAHRRQIIAQMEAGSAVREAARAQAQRSTRSSSRVAPAGDADAKTDADAKASEPAPAKADSKSK